MISSLEKKDELQGYAFNGFFLDVIKKQLRYKEMLLKLENGDFEILLFLVEKHPNPAKNEEIRAIFPRNTSAIKAKQLTEKSISRIRKQIAFIRKNYKDDTEHLRHLVIETIKNKGYCLHADVEKIYFETTKPETEAKVEGISKETPQFHKSFWNNSILKIMQWVLLICVIGILIGLFYYLRKEAPLKIKKADIVLNMKIEKWKPLTKEQQEGKGQFKAVIENYYELEKTTEVNGFDVRFGLTTNGLLPEFENFSKYPILQGGIPEDITNEFKKCNEKIDALQWRRFDISKENISSQFNISYNLNAFNAHNNPEIEDHIQVIYYPTQNLNIKVNFPENKPFKKVTYLKKKICDNTFHSQNPPAKTTPDETVSEYVIEEPTGKEVIWHIENPDVYYMYQIQWNW